MLQFFVHLDVLWNVSVYDWKHLKAEISILQDLYPNGTVSKIAKIVLLALRCKYGM